MPPIVALILASAAPIDYISLCRRSRMGQAMIHHLDAVRCTRPGLF